MCISVINISFTVEFCSINIVNGKICMKLCKSIECTEYITTWGSMLGLVPSPTHLVLQ